MQISQVSMQAGAGWLPKAVVTHKPVANRLNICLHQSLWVSHLACRQLNALHTTSRHAAASLLYQCSQDGHDHRPVLLVFHSVWGEFTAGGGCRYRFLSMSVLTMQTVHLPLPCHKQIKEWNSISQFKGKRHKWGTCKLFLHFRCREIYSGFWRALLLFCMMLCFNNNAS